MSTGLIFDGVAGSEALDSSGERLSIEGCDCSAWDSAEGILFNYEHADASSGPSAIVGKVVYLKKIYERSDCEDERQRMYWDRIKQPLIYVKGRLWDGAGHEGAKALAAIMRDNAANNEPLVCRLSIEGSTLRRDGGDLLESMCLAIAITTRPCNKTADTALLEDPNAPAGYEQRHDGKKVSKLLEDAFKSEPTFGTSFGRRLGGVVEFVGNPIVEDPIAKTFAAGSYDAAPSSLTGGAALQREVMDGPSKKDKLKSKALDAFRRYMEQRSTFDKAEFRTLLRHELPEASDEYLDHFEKIVDDVQVKRSQVSKSDPMVLLDSWGISLRKHLNDLRSSILFGDPRKPTIYSVSMKVSGDLRLAGRFILINNELHILEDYFGLIAKAIPEGPLTSSTVNMIQAMQQSPDIEVKETPYVPPEPQGNEISPQPDAPIPAPAPVRAPVFDYHRVGFDEPHTVEFHGGNVLLDAKLITPEEAAAILANVSSGAATLRYKAPDLAGTIAKMEEQFADLAKGMRQPPGVKPASSDDGTTPLNPSSTPHAQDLLAHIRAAEAAGHIPKGTSEGMTQHVYGDPMVPGLGNRKAWEEFRSKNKPGVYVGMDLNDLKKLNTHSHAMGDDAIRTYGKTLRSAIDEAAPGVGKLFRVGGDEMTAHFPSNEHAMAFARKLHEKLEAVPPMGGIHKLSTGMGFGINPEQADQALSQAKSRKYHPGQEHIADERDRTRVFPAGSTPNMAHSLVPGSEGAVPLHSPQTSALAAHAELPKPQSGPAAAPPEPKMPKPEVPKPPAMPKTATPTGPKAPTAPKQPKAA